MKNKGFSLIECVACLFLLSTVTIGIISVCLILEHNANERLYKNALYSNFHTIFRVCDLSNEPKKMIYEVYKDALDQINDNQVILRISLEKPYLQKEAIEYLITFEEDLENKKVKIQVLNLESKYEEINNEILSQRYYPK